MTHLKWPFYYTAKIKRSPGFLIKQVFLEEFLIVLLVFTLFLPTMDLRALASLVFLFAAMISVYEIGYAENDRIGQKKEADPKLSREFQSLGQFVIARYSWMWAVGFTIIGLCLLSETTRADALMRLGLGGLGTGLSAIATMTVIWLFMVGLCQAIFAIFNHVGLIWRVYVYVPLHISKYLAPIVFFEIELTGAILLAAHIVRTWTPYAIRRSGGDIDFLSSQLIRLVFFTMMIAFAGLALPEHEIWMQWQTWLIFAFCGLRAAPEVRRKMLSGS